MEVKTTLKEVKQGLIDLLNEFNDSEDAEGESLVLGSLNNINHLLNRPEPKAVVQK